MGWPPGRLAGPLPLLGSTLFPTLDSILFCLGSIPVTMPCCGLGLLNEGGTVVPSMAGGGTWGGGPNEPLGGPLGGGTHPAGR